MCLQRFASSVLILLLFVPGKENSLLSRFRNPNQFVASEREEGILLDPEDFDEKLYDDIVRQVPGFKEYWKRERNREHIAMPYLKKKSPRGEHEMAMADSNPDEMEVNARPPPIPPSSTALAEAEDEAAAAAAAAASRAPPPSSSLLVNGSLAARASPLQNNSRRWFWDPPFYWWGYYKASCYRCGLYESGIPKSPICYDAWNSDDWRARTTARYYMAKCYYNWSYWADRAQPGQKLWDRKWDRTWDRGLIWEYYGTDFTGGCFKRWTDVGKVYTQRGCRAHPPLGANSFASHRFRRLELTLKHQSEACTHSSHASLTPFARGISLFVRYHVCVCSKGFCNRSGPRAARRSLTREPLLILMSLYVLFV